MGFKYRRIDFKGSGTGQNFHVFYDWTHNGTVTPESCSNRSLYIISSIASALKEMGIGWNLDSSYGNTWIEDPDHEGCFIIQGTIEVPIMSGTDKMPGIVLINSESGNRLFLGYLSNSNSYGIDLPTEQLVSAGTFNSYGPNKDRPSYTGLVVSMIPGDSTQRFGSFSDGTFIPSHATRVYGMCEANNTKGTSVTTKSSYGRASFQTEYSKYWFCYGVLATPYCIAIAANHSALDESSQPIYPEHLQLSFACGRILGGLSNDESLPQAKYGVIQFSLPNGRACMEEGRTSELGVSWWTTNNIGFDYGSEEQTYGCSSFRNPYAFANAQGNGKCISLLNIFKADGTAIGLTSTANVRVQPDPYLQLSHNLKDDNATVKWCPFTVGVVSTNLSKDGIIPGEGLKGYLDTDLFRCARVAQGQTFSNGSFYSLPFNLVIGWDSSNTSL